MLIILRGGPGRNLVLGFFQSFCPQMKFRNGRMQRSALPASGTGLYVMSLQT